MLATARRHIRWLLLGTASYLAVGILAPRLAVAEVATDGTMGRRVSLRGGNTEIGADLGQRRGGNLFHSFQKFDVETRGRVAFTGPDSVKNVIGRVTGGDPSSIDGTLASTIPDADLYLINPAGILFGPNARLDVKGSFHASTADELQLADGAVFSALDTAGSTLSVAPPQAFGFLGVAPADISLNRGVLQVPDGKSLSLSGGNVVLSAGDNGRASRGPDGQVVAPAGRIIMAGVGQSALYIDSGEVSGDVSGTVRLNEQAFVDTSGIGGGSIIIRGSEISLSGRAFIFADNYGNLNAGGGVLISGGSLSVSGGSAVTADSVVGSGAAGGVTIRTANVEITDGGRLKSNALGQGSAGAVSVDTRQLLIDRAGSTIVTGILSQAESGSNGTGGNILVAADQIVINNGGVITNSTFGAGDAGNIDIKAGRLLVDRSGSKYTTGIFNQAEADSTGAAGNITVAASKLEVRNGGQISISTFAQGNAGRVDITAQRLLIDRAGSEFGTGIIGLAFNGSTGTAGIVAVAADELDMRNGGQISSSTFAQGDAGGVDVRADALALRAGASITSSTFAAGDAGTIEVSAGQLLIDATGAGLDQFSGISSSAGYSSTGNAGQVMISANALELRAGAAIQSSTFASGNAGTVEIRAHDLRLNSGGFIASETFSQGDAGSVLVRTVVAHIGPSSRISSSTSYTGNAGNIEVAAQRSLTLDGAQIESSSSGAGLGGDVTISGPQLRLERKGVIAASGSGSGAAGNVAVSADVLEAQDGGIRTAGTGAAGGRIEVVAADRIYLRDSEVTSSGIQADDGASVISMRAPQIIS